VLKPISGCSSFATYLVKDEAALHQSYHKTVDDAPSHLKTSGIHSDDETELIWARGFDMTLEQFLDGEEFDVDVLLSEGAVAYASVSRDLPQPYMKETGSQMPPAFPQDKQNELIEFAGVVLRALEFTDGSFHVELKYTSQGPRLIEVNARIGGGPIYKTHRAVWGVDLVEQYLLTRLGVPIRPLKAPQPLTCRLTAFISSPYSGIVTNTEFLTPVAKHPQVISHKYHVKVGERVIGSDKGVPAWLGEITVQGDSVEQVSNTVETLLAQVEVPIASA
jgi:carnosine synthase